MVKNFIKNYKKWYFLVPFTLFILVSYFTFTHQLDTLDIYVYTKISKIVTPIITTILNIFTITGTIGFMLLISFLLVFKYYKISKFLIFHAIVIDLLNYILKMVFMRERPTILWLTKTSGYSFPSAHMMVSTCFYGLCIYLLMKSSLPYKRIYSMLLFVLILIIGISRIYLGVHYFSDIMGGALCGITYLLIIINNSRFKT